MNLRQLLALLVLLLVCGSSPVAPGGEPFTGQDRPPAPAKIVTYPIGPVVSVVTTITGEARNNAQILIKAGDKELYSLTLTQSIPKATVPHALILGDVTIEEGAHFVLTIPTSTQRGQVFASMTIKTSTSTTPFGALVATWKLPSSDPADEFTTKGLTTIPDGPNRRTAWPARIAERSPIEK